MTNFKVQVSFDCESCGQRLSWDDSALDCTKIFCKKCGKYFGTYADLRRKAIDDTRAKVVSKIKDVLKRNR